MIIYKRKTKDYKTEKEAQSKNDELKKLKVKGKDEFRLVEISADVEQKHFQVRSEKEILSEDEIVADVDVDSVEVHFCDHDQDVRHGCELIADADEAKRRFREFHFLKEEVKESIIEQIKTFVKK